MPFRSTFVILIVVALAVVTAMPLGADPAKIKAAETAGRAWLTQVDAGKYAESWDAAAKLFKEKLPKEDWVKMASGAREPLGKLTSRQVQNTEYVTELPGMPDGQYVVIEYESAFQNKSSAAEALTMMLEPDGKWRSIGYFVR